MEVKDKKILPPKAKQWERFQHLKSRREMVSKKSSKNLVKKITRTTLKTVKNEVSIEDVKDVLQSEGIIPACGGSPSPVTTPTSPPLAPLISPDTEDSSSNWKDVKSFLTPNPILEPSLETAELEEEMNSAIKRGRLDEAVELSDEISKVEFSSKISTAIDCQKFVKMRQKEEERRRKRKSKLQWRYEHKQRWEMKSNM